MSKISRPDLTAALTKFFLSAGENPNPSELAEEVLFTFPFADATNKLITMVNSVTAGLAGIQVIDLPVVPDDEYWLYHVIDSNHNDTTARSFRLFLFDPARVFEVCFAAIINRVGGVQFPVRNVLVPPGWNIRVRCSVGGAFIFSSQATHTEHGLAEPVMNVSS